MIKKKSLLALVLAGVLVCMTGCAATSDAGKDGVIVGSDEIEQTGSTNEGMGRYVEEDVEINADLSWTSKIFQLEDGSMAYFDYIKNQLNKSSDGQNWSPVENTWIQDRSENFYSSDVVISPKGELAMRFTEDDPEDVDAYNPKFGVVTAEGEFRELPFDIPGQDEENGMARNSYRSLVFGKDDKLYGQDSDGVVYEINKETGDTTELFATSEARSMAMDCVGKFLIVVDGDKKTSIYNTETTELLQENTALDDFFADPANLADGYTAGTEPIIFCNSQEDDSFYFATKSGLYNYVVGGSVVEQLVSGELSTFGDPTIGMVGMRQDTDGSFLVLFSGAKLIRLIYNPDISSVPGTQLNVYSLYDNDMIRRINNQFQKDNPDAYVKLEIGMNGEDGITYEDALKNLNTQIMAGKGPDVLILNDLPVDTYQEKGVLMDLTETLTIIGEKTPLLSNIANSYGVDGKTYAIPVTFQIPFLVGDVESLGRVNDLKSLADEVENIRKENPDGCILGTYSEDELIRTLCVGSANALMNGNEINEDALREFLTEANRIYQAEQAGITEQMKTEHEQEYNSLNGEEWSDISFSSVAFNIWLKEMKLGIGYSMGIDYDVTTYSSVIREVDTIGCKECNLMSKNLYLPGTVIGINQSTSNADAAKQYLESALSDTTQEATLDGYPVNQKAFEAALICPQEDENIGMMGTSDETGKTITLNMYWPTKELQDQVYEYAKSLTTPLKMDEGTISTIVEYATNVFAGTETVDAAVKDIQDKMAIRLAE